MVVDKWSLLTDGMAVLTCRVMILHGERGLFAQRNGHKHMRQDRKHLHWLGGEEFCVFFTRRLSWQWRSYMLVKPRSLLFEVLLELITA